MLLKGIYFLAQNLLFDRKWKYFYKFKLEHYSWVIIVPLQLRMARILKVYISRVVIVAIIGPIEKGWSIGVKKYDYTTKRGILL